MTEAVTARNEITSAVKMEVTKVSTAVVTEACTTVRKDTDLAALTERVTTSMTKETTRGRPCC